MDRAARSGRLLATSSGRLCLFDAEGRHLYADRNGARTIGPSPDRVIGETWRGLGFPLRECVRLEPEREAGTGISLAVGPRLARAPGGRDA